MNFLSCLEPTSGTSKAVGQYVTLPNCLRVGKTRFGKSKAMLRDTLSLCMPAMCSVVVFDPHGLLARELLMHLVANGLGDRVLFDVVSRTDTALGFEFLTKSNARNFLDRRAESEIYNREFAEPLARRRGINDLALHPLIEEWLMAALQLWQSQKIDLPLYFLPYALQPHSEQFDKFIEHCLDPHLKERFKQLKRWSPTMVRRELGGALRVLENVCFSPAFMCRCKETASLKNILENKGIIILSGEGMISRSALRDIFGCVMRRVSQLIRRNWQSTQSPLPVHMVVDETFNAGLFGVYESADLCETQKMGQSWDLATQWIPLDEKELVDHMLHGINRYECFNVTAERQVEFMAKLIGTPQIESHKIHHETEHKGQRIDGIEEYDTETTTDHGDGKGSTSKGVRSRPIHQDIVNKTEHYWSLSDQILMLRKDLQTLPVGHRWVFDCGRVWKEYVPLLESPYPFMEELAEERTNQFLEEMEKRPCFVKPQIFLPRQRESSSKKGFTTRKR